jgi:CheY-like chemotaxis protein
MLRGMLEGCRDPELGTVPAIGAEMSLYGHGNKTLTALSGGYATDIQARNDKGNTRIFVVDDEDFIRELYRDFFESRGVTVYSARTGDEAVRLFQEMRCKPDAIIMDHRMPGKDGIETTREILKLDPTVPIIFSSADESVREKALEAGAVSFWAKPFPVGLLVNAMLDIVEAKKKRR